MEQIAYGTKNDKKSDFFSATAIENGLYNRKKKRNLIPLITKKTKPKVSLLFLLLSKSQRKEMMVIT